MPIHLVTLTEEQRKAFIVALGRVNLVSTKLPQGDKMIAMLATHLDTAAAIFTALYDDIFPEPEEGDRDDRPS